MSFGKFTVDYEQRIFNPERMRKYRLDRAQAMLKKYGLGSMIIIDLDSMKYLSYSRRMGWNRHRLGVEILLLIRDAGYPYCPEGEVVEQIMPWYKGKTKLKHRFPFQVRFTLDQKYNTEQWTLQAEEIKGLLKEHGVVDLPCGLDTTCIHMVDVFRKVGIDIVSGTEAIAEARMIKNEDEIECIRTAGSITEAAMWEVCKTLRPGMTEMQVAGVAAKACYDHGAEELEGPSFVVLSGPRTGMRVMPRTATDRVIRPGDMVVLDINGVGFMGYRTCFYRTFCVGDKPTEKQKELYQAALEGQLSMENAVKRGCTNHDVAKAMMKDGEGKWFNGASFPEPGKYWGMTNHDLGLCSGDPGPGPGYPRLSTLEQPINRIEKGRVFALEVSCAEWDGKKWGYDGVKIENVGVVTDTGWENLYRFPYKDLMAVGLPGVY